MIKLKCRCKSRKERVLVPFSAVAENGNSFSGNKVLEENMKKYEKADCIIVLPSVDDVITMSNELEYPSKWLEEGGENGDF